jgi:hypothetical protein
MASRFDRNTINLESTSNPLPPSTSSEVKIFNDGNTLSKIDFSGKISPLVEIPKIVPNITEITSEDELVILDPARLIMSFPLKDLQNKLSNLLKLIQEKSSIKDLNGIIESFNNSLKALSSNLEDNSNRSENDLKVLEQTFNETIRVLDTSLNDLVNAKESNLKQDLESFKSEVAQFFINVNESLRNNVTKQDLRIAIQAIPKVEPIVIKAGSPNVTVEKTNNEYSIAVDIPKVSRQVASMGGGGISKSAVEKIVEDALANSSVGSNTSIIAGSGISVVESPEDTFTISSIPTSGEAFLPIAGNGITLSPGAGSYTFAVTDYISKTESRNVSGALQEQINNKASIGSLSAYTLLSTTSSISAYLNDKIDSINLVQGSNITIVESPANTWTISSVGGGGGSSWTPVQGTGISITAPTTASYQFSVIDYISKTTVVGLSGDLQSQINNKASIGSLSSYTPLSTTSGISAQLNSKIDSINVLAGKDIVVSENVSNTFVVALSSSAMLTNIKANDAQGIILKTNTGNTIVNFGSGGSQSATFSDGVTLTSLAGHSNKLLKIDTNGLVQVDSYSTSEIISQVASVSAQLNDKIDSINLVQGSNITIVESPTNTWTISSVPMSGSGATQLDELSDVTLTTPTSGQVLSYNGSQWVNKNPTRNIPFTILSSSVITSGAKDVMFIAPFRGSITNWKLSCTPSATITMDVLKGSGVVPTTSIISSNNPSISAGQIAFGDVSGWTTPFEENDIFKIKVLSNNLAKVITLQLNCTEE